MRDAPDRGWQRHGWFSAQPGQLLFRGGFPYIAGPYSTRALRIRVEQPERARPDGSYRSGRSLVSLGYGRTRSAVAAVDSRAGLAICPAIAAGLQRFTYRLVSGFR